MATIGDALFVAGLSIVVSLIISIPFLLILYMWGSNLGIALICELAMGFIGTVVFTYFLLNASEQETEELKSTPPTETFQERYHEEIERRKRRNQNSDEKE